MRLIDADAYRAAMKERQDACVKWRNEARENGDAEDLVRAEQALSGFIEAKLTLDYTPTVDAVPVVRCKDCRYCCKEDDWTMWCTSASPAFLTTPEDYCSHGRRRDAEG